MKIGITLDMSIAFWANGMQQNIVFLYDMLKRIGHECYYITQKKPAYFLSKKHQGLMLDEVLSDESFNLDILIVAGFDLLPGMYDELKKRNSKFNTILVHFGNKLMDDIHYSINEKKNKIPLEKPNHLSQIWISPQHAFAKNYIKSYYDHQDVRIAPFIWDSFFVEDKLKDLKQKNLSPAFSNEKSKSICIFEPNISSIKHCLIPINICENLYKKNPELIDKVNVFCCEKIRLNKFFEKLMMRLNIVKIQDKCFFNNRWSSLNAISKFGCTIVSHQINNELNYSYLESLFLDLPLIHNSPTLQDVGYYYPEFDVEMGANQLKSAMLNHKQVLKEYRADSRKFLKQFSLFNEKNIHIYNLNINEAVKQNK